MTLDEIKLKLEPLARQVITAQGLEMIAFNVKGRPQDVYIQVLADKPSGGINIGECVILNKSLLAAIEQEKFLPRAIFSLEVSSPGIDRHR